MRRRMQPFSARLIVTETVTCAESLCIPSLHITVSVKLNRALLHPMSH
ncbi:unnamed protein product, partial [Staurois parvus]